MSKVVKFPTPPIRPDLPKCRKALELCEGDPEHLLFAAFNGLQLVFQ